MASSEFFVQAPNPSNVLGAKTSRKQGRDRERERNKKEKEYSWALSGFHHLWSSTFPACSRLVSFRLTLSLHDMMLPYGVMAVIQELAYDKKY